MATNKTIARNRANAKAGGLKLPLTMPAARQARAKPAAMTDETTMAVKKVEPSAVAKKTALKPAAREAKPRPRAQTVTKMPKRPGKTAGGNEPIADGWAAAAKGAETLGQEFIGLASDSLQAQLALTGALIDARTPAEALTLQGNFARESLEITIEGVAKLTGMSLVLTQAIMSPVQVRQP